MFARRFAAISFVALCLLASPRAAFGQQQQAPTREGTPTYRTNKTLSRVIICGSIGAIAGALGSLRVRRGNDAIDRDDEGTTSH